MSDHERKQLEEQVNSMWWCPECQTWNGTKLPACLGCERERPRVPVTMDNVPVSYSKNVTLNHRVRAKLTYLYQRVTQ